MTNQSKIEAAKNDNFCRIEFDMITQLEKMAVQSIPIDSIWLCYVGMHLPTTSIRIWHSKRMRQRLKRSTTFVLKIHLKIDKARDKFTFERSCDVWPIDS